MLPFCEDDLPREVCQAQVRNITCFMHKQLPGKSIGPGIGMAHSQR